MGYGEKPAQEGWRKAALQVLAVIAGITTAWLSSAAIPKSVGIPDDWTGTLALGLLASGGSGFWNSILTYVTKAKDLKAAEAETSRSKRQRSGRVFRSLVISANLPLRGRVS
jgi:hypothetical protein